MWIIESITFVLIPFCIITFCYFRIPGMSSNQDHLSRAWASISEAQQNAENTRLKKTGNTFGIITGRFILLVMPSFIFNCIFFYLRSHLTDHEWGEMQWFEQENLDLYSCYFTYQRDLWPLGLRNKNAWFQNGFKTNFPVYVPHYTPLIKRICREPRRT